MIEYYAILSTFFDQLLYPSNEEEIYRSPEFDINLS